MHSLPEKLDLCVFDFCGTLYRSNTTLDFLQFLVPRAGSGYASRHQTYKLVAGLARRTGLADARRHIGIRIHAVRGLRREFLEREAVTFVRDWLHPLRRLEAFELFDHARSVGGQIVISSYTLDLILEAFRRRHPVSAAIGSTLRYTRDGVATGRFDRQLHGEGKLSALLEAHGAERVREAVFVTDDEAADRDLFEFVRHPILLT